MEKLSLFLSIAAVILTIVGITSETISIIKRNKSEIRKKQSILHPVSRIKIEHPYKVVEPSISILEYSIKTSKNRTDDLFGFVLKAANGEPILVSEKYKSRASAKNGIASFKENAQFSTSYEVKTSKDKKYYFVLKSSNHQVIGTSEMYNSEAAMKEGIATVKKAAPCAKLDDIIK